MWEGHPQQGLQLGILPKEAHVSTGLFLHVQTSETVIQDHHVTTIHAKDMPACLSVHL